MATWPLGRESIVLTAVRIENYRSLHDVSVELAPLTVLVGRNGAGKSNFVDALGFTADCLRTGLDEAVRSRGGTASIGFRRAPGASADLSFCISGLYGQLPWRYELGLLDTGDGVKVQREQLLFDEDVVFGMFAGQWQRYPLEQAPEWADDRLFLPVLGIVPVPQITESIRSVVAHDYRRSSLLASVEPNDAPSADRHLANVASILESLRRQQPGRLAELNERLSQALGFDIEASAQRTDLGRLVLGTRRAGSHHEPVGDARSESDGTLWLIAVMAVLYQLKPPSVLIIEEPERHLHPGALAVLCEELEEAALRTQVIVTTHSPELISLVPLESLRVVEWEDTTVVGPDGRRWPMGETQIGPLDPEQVEVVRRELFRPGELMRIDGQLRRDRTSLATTLDA